jgi:hypothetical protein
MGRASSSKKVARAAGIGGGRTSRGRRPWSYYSILLLIVVLGSVGVVVSRHDRFNSVNVQGKTPPLAEQANWHEAYGIDVCGKFLPPIKSTNDPEGINTEGDGVIYIHPFHDSAAGKNATLSKFASAVGMTVNAGELAVPGYKVHFDGDKCNGKQSYVQLQTFVNSSDKIGFLYDKDPATYPFADNQMITIAFLPHKATIPPPPAEAIKDMLHPKTINLLGPGEKPLPTTTTLAPPPTTASTATTATTAPGATTTAGVSPSTASGSATTASGSATTGSGTPTTSVATTAPRAATSTTKAS